MTYSNLLAGRFSAPGLVYLVTSVTSDRQAWFADFALARAVVAEMRHLHDSGAVQSIAWVLMPDHLHWLIQLGEQGTLAQVMKSFKGRSAQALHAMGHAPGPVWQRGYHDRALRREEDVLQVARYLAANPLRAGLVQSLGDYPHWDAVWV
ncbi:transposase [Rhodoferax sp.]|uniref:REP-associated tyrosine transposase n=1 Tax=Rhodoferax sp. TaxID=50421 RepID=UPI0025DD8268|nr:transposase [Rhodoferax sp.]MCM2341734.1 transposase [Rhodoferax sp.]